MCPLTASSEDVPSICDTGDTTQLLACPQTCRAACENVKFATRSTEISDTCSDVVLAADSGTQDAAFCPAAEAENKLFIPKGWHADVKLSCNSAHPPIDSSIPQLQDIIQSIPGCVVSLNNLACRVDRISARTSVFQKLVDEFEPLQFGANMCELKSDDVDSAYTRAQQFGEPLGVLTEALEAEQDCQNQVREWINAQGCNEGDPGCQIDQAKEFALGQFRDRLTVSVEQAAKIPTILKRAKETQARIEGGYGFYKLVCS